MTDKVYSIGHNGYKECGGGENRKVPTLIPGVEGFGIVQVAAGYGMAIFLTNEGDILETGKYNKSGEPFLKHEIPEPILKIKAGHLAFFALTALGNVYGWGGNSFHLLGVQAKGENHVSSPRKIPFLRKKPES